MDNSMKKDLQAKYDHLISAIQSTKRQALDDVRKNAVRIGKISFTVEFAYKNGIMLQVDSDKYEKLRKRVTEKDLSAAAVGAGIDLKLALSMMDCEFARGYNHLRDKLMGQYKKAIFPEKKKPQCRATNQWDKDRKATTGDLRTNSPFFP